MTGYEVLKRAMSLSGAELNAQNAVGNGVLLRARDFINQVCFDLRIQGIEGLSDSFVDCTDRQLEALCYGTAMLMTLSEGSSKNSVFTQIYNAKRSSALSSKTGLRDVLPKGDGGVSLQ